MRLRDPVLCAAVLMLVAGCGDSSSAEATGAAAKAGANPGAPFDAQAAYDTVCATCHGKKGDGRGPAGVVLNPRPSSFIKKEFWATRDRDHIINVTKNGGASVGKSARMIPYANAYNDEEIAAIADIVLKFRPNEPVAPGGSPARNEPAAPGAPE